MNMAKTAIFAILAFLLILATVNAEKRDAFILTLEYNSGSITLESIRAGKIPFNERKSSPHDNYLLEYLSFDGKVLYSLNFYFPLEIGGSPPDPEWFDEDGNQVYIPTVNKSSRRLEKAFVELIVPSSENGRFVRISDYNGGIAMEIDLTAYLEFCNNDNACDGNENTGGCPQDCPSGGDDTYCDRISDDICDPDCIARSDADCVPSDIDSDSPNPILLTAAALSIITAGLAATAVLRKRQSRRAGLRDFVNSARAKGFSEQQISEALTRKGVSQNDIKSLRKEK